ncbi:hypothetical protein MSP7336_01836 [Mycobacterium shimoidei]|uniref:Uncharacterized protein n=1 Tax=Mycobacterium shimoidei TaxID=29313 RepID=A0A375YXL4_MYCSH|nr:hypothetical protein [Mycobacterium shimoidei]SRX93597.1 hypothetical protein MSP7336_01836 [Mycobacterium shimoidei]
MSDKTLPPRMREAAKVIEEATERRDKGMLYDDAWTPGQLLYWASRWEADERLVDELAREMFNALYPQYATESYRPTGAWFSAAQRLIESGWRKGDPQ